MSSPDDPSNSARSRCRIWALALRVAVLLLLGGCVNGRQKVAPACPSRDINAVLADHDNELLSIPGVVGVYVGLLDDNKTPCLKVMLERSDAGLEQKLPRTLEGYPVITEVTGTIRPLK